VKSVRPVLIYLPGLDGTGKLFYQQEANLAPYCEVRVLAVPLDDRRDWPELTQQVLDLLPGPEQPVILCGESFGGCIALLAALAWPGRFRHLVLINPATSWRRQTLLQQGAQGLSILPAFTFRFAALFFMPFLVTVSRMKREDRRVLLAILRLVPAETIIHRLKLLDSLNVDDELHRLTLPVLLVAGAADRLLPSLAEVKHLAELMPDARIEVLPYSGHAVLIESEMDLARLLLQYDFLMRTE